MTCKILLRLNLNGTFNFPSHVPPVLSAPPRSVSVVQLTNSSTISVSWEPPPQSAQSSLILEYKVRPEMLRRDLKLVMDEKKKELEQTVLAVWEFVLVPVFLLIH